jgi:quercetin dioxygenase-like cupin family protein
VKALRPTKKLVLTGALLGLGAMIVASVALATHVTGSQPAEVLITRTVDLDGLESGWHTHPGPVIVQVESGHFMMYQGSCAAKIVGPGETYIEVPNVPINAVAKSAITWTTTLIIPDSAAPRTAAADPCA